MADTFNTELSAMLYRVGPVKTKKRSDFLDEQNVCDLRKIL